MTDYIKHHNPKLYGDQELGLNLLPERTERRIMYDYKEGREYCVGCCQMHQADKPDALVKRKGCTYEAPFFCLCCGVQICESQFAFYSYCVYCQSGACQWGMRDWL